MNNKLLFSNTNISPENAGRRIFLKNSGSTALLATTGATIAGSSALFLPSSDAFAKNKTFQTVDYGPQKMDVYPARSNRLANEMGLSPVIAFVHGGAWRMGNRGQVGRKPQWYTKQGYTFVSIGYRLYPFANVGKQADQIGEATGYIASNIAKFGGDPSRVALMGHSAGCHLASLATLSGRTQNVKALVCNDTRAYDLPFLASLHGNHLPMLYARPFHKRKHWEEWSPAAHVGSRTHPPVFVSWSSGTNRDVISKNFMGRFHANGLGVNAFDGSKKYNHLSINSAMGRKSDALTSSLDLFLKQTV